VFDTVSALPIDAEPEDPEVCPECSIEFIDFDPLVVPRRDCRNIV
jgi:hypothetical protein